MSATQEVEAAWVQPFTVADQCRIDAMDDATRAVVERYVRSGSPVRAKDADDLAMRIAEQIDVERQVRRAIVDVLNRERNL